MALAGLGMAGVPLSVLHAAEDPGEGTPGLEVLAANVNAFSPATTDADRLALEAALTADRAAVVLVLEKRPLALPGYVRAADNFDDDLPRASHATAIFCREDVSCAAEVTAEFGSDTSQMPLGWVRVQGALAAPVCLGALHAPPPVPNVIWHVAENGEAMGPFTPAQMSQAIAGGRVTPTSLVWCAGMEGWLVAAEVDALAGQFAPAPPPVPEG